MTLRKIGYAAVVAVSAAAFVLGSAATGEAKAKKKMEAAPLTPTCLLTTPHPVCGEKGGMKFTYNNGCYADKDGAKVVAYNACPAKAAKKGKKKKK